MQYVDRTFSAFDPAQPLVAARRMTLMSEEVSRGEPISDDVPVDVKRRLWMSRHIDYVNDFRPTPELPPAPAVATFAATGGGWFDVTAPWLAAPLRVRGEKNAKAEAERLTAEGPPAELKPVEGPAAEVLVTEDGEDYLVTAPWLEGPERFADAGAAEARQEELRLAGPPEGWVPLAGDSAAG